AGVADDPDGTLTDWELAWSSLAAGPWTVFANGNTPETGVLGALPAIPEGFNYLRLVVTNCAGQTSTFTKVIIVDRTFQSAVITSPANGAIVGGVVCIGGTCTDSCFDNYRLEYRHAGIGPYNVLLVSNVPVSNNTLGTLDTVSLALPDGD